MHSVTRGLRVMSALVLAVLLAHAPAAAAATPSLSFWASKTSVKPGESVKLSWKSSNAKRCESTGDWPNGRRKLASSWNTPALKVDSRFRLTCYGSDGTSVTRSVFVDVVESTSTGTGSTTPTVTPTLKLQASASSVASGGSVTLTWTGEGVSNCTASGSWSGSRASSGSELRTGLTANQSYTLSCSSASGTIMAMTSVKVTSGGVQLSWQAPAERIDGSPLTDLSGYRIYVGTLSKSYYQQIDVNDPTKTQAFLNLEPGEYFIAMTAVDGDGAESPLSNEVRRIVD